MVVLCAVVVMLKYTAFTLQELKNLIQSVRYVNTNSYIVEAAGKTYGRKVLQQIFEGIVNTQDLQMTYPSAHLSRSSFRRCANFKVEALLL